MLPLPPLPARDGTVEELETNDILALSACGSDRAVKQLYKFFSDTLKHYDTSVDYCYLLIGPSGTGKKTLVNLLVASISTGPPSTSGHLHFTTDSFTDRIHCIRDGVFDGVFDEVAMDRLREALVEKEKEKEQLLPNGKIREVATRFIATSSRQRTVCYLQERQRHIRDTSATHP